MLLLMIEQQTDKTKQKKPTQIIWCQIQAEGQVIYKQDIQDKNKMTENQEHKHMQEDLIHQS